MGESSLYTACEREAALHIWGCANRLVFLEPSRVCREQSVLGTEDVGNSGRRSRRAQLSLLLQVSSQSLPLGVGAETSKESSSLLPSTVNAIL